MSRIVVVSSLFTGGVTIPGLWLSSTASRENR